MPSLENILSPLTIIGNACSGASLVARALGKHSQCSFVGETVDLVHSVWKSLELYPAKKQLEIPDTIRHHFLRLFPSRSQYWLHLPVGVPMARTMFDREETFLDWYWEVLERVFPRAKYLTVLRHPLDVLVSSSESPETIESIINCHRVAAKTITHPRSRVMYAVNYHDMLRDGRKEIGQMLAHLGLDFEEPCLEPLEQLSVANSSHETPCPHQSRLDTADCFSQREQWDRIPRSLIATEYREAVDACWAKFGCNFGGWPC